MVPGFAKRKDYSTAGWALGKVIRALDWENGVLKLVTGSPNPPNLKEAFSAS